MWTFREYVKLGGKRELSQWFGELSDDDAATAQVALEFLSQTERTNWRRPKFDVLHNSGGLGEVILGKVGGVQTRLVGFFGPGPYMFTVVLVVTKKEKNYSPSDWIKIAKKRRLECQSDSGRMNVWVP